VQALVFTAPGRVELLDVAAPQPVRGESLVQVMASGICGSELHGFRSVGMRVPPLVMGHEFAGRTESGRRVVVNPLISCGECAACRRGQPQVCRSRQLLGAHRAGGFGELAAVPDSALHDLPDAVSWSAATLVEPLANAVHAWDHVPDDVESAAVVGAGSIGLLCAQVGRARGVDVVVTEPSAHRREVAGRLGLNVVDALDGEYDAVLDAVGLETTRRLSIEHCRPAGSSVWVGLGEDVTSLGGHDVVRFERRISGTFAYTPANFARAVELATELDLSWTTDVPMSRSEQVFMSLAGGATDIVKAAIVPDAAVPDGTGARP
jgi:threonine dehydrogenase-like Zn-dependent dehydrogenase